jgi:transcriptional regulator with XRE-family HTH domain
MYDALFRREFARKLMAARERKGWSDMELARRSKIPQPTLHDYQNPHEGNPPALPRGDRLARLAQALDVSTDYLLGLTQNPQGGSATPGQAFQEGGMRALADVRDAIGKIETEWRGGDAGTATSRRSSGAEQMIDEAEVEARSQPRRRKKARRQRGA